VTIASSIPIRTPARIILRHSDQSFGTSKVASDSSRPKNCSPA